MDRLIYTPGLINFIYWEAWLTTQYGIDEHNQRSDADRLERHILKTFHLACHFDSNYKNINLPVLTLIFWAIIRPPITAMAVQRLCPRIPPKHTPQGS